MSREEPVLNGIWLKARLGAGYIDTAEAERLEGELAAGEAKIEALKERIAQLEQAVESAVAEANANFKEVIDRSAVNPVLPSGLTSIGSNAFANSRELTLPLLPAGLTSIGSSAFNGCYKLALTSLPAGLTSIENNAFSSCSELALTSLPAGLTSIGSSAFSSCSELALTSLPAGLISVGAYTFNNCSGLQGLTFAGTPKSLTSNAFYNCLNLKTINVPWAEGAVSGAPWGATKATINYNYTGGDA